MDESSNLRAVVEVVPVVAGAHPVVVGGGVVGLVVGVSRGVVELAGLGVLAGGLGVKRSSGLTVESLQTSTKRTTVSEPVASAHTRIPAPLPTRPVQALFLAPAGSFPLQESETRRYCLSLQRLASSRTRRAGERSTGARPRRIEVMSHLEHCDRVDEEAAWVFVGLFVLFPARCRA